MNKEGFKIALDDIREKVSDRSKQRFHIGFERKSLQVELYRPLKEDLQQPHDRDECYIITKGNGEFIMGDKKVNFTMGDFLFVPAKMPHKFINFGESMEAWVIFYGPKGGE